MNKFITLLFCLSIFTCALSQGQNAEWTINSEDIEEFNLAEEGAINEEDEGLTDGIFVDINDNQIIEWEENLGGAPASEEEGEFGEFTEGIIVGGDDHQIPPFEDESSGAPISEEEGAFAEEEESGDFTEGILIEGDDNQIPPFVDDEPSVPDRIDVNEEAEFGEWQGEWEGEAENTEFSVGRNFLA